MAYVRSSWMMCRIGGVGLLLMLSMSCSRGYINSCSQRVCMPRFWQHPWSLGIMRYQYAGMPRQGSLLQPTSSPSLGCPASGLCLASQGPLRQPPSMVGPEATTSLTFPACAGARLLSTSTVWCLKGAPPCCTAPCSLHLPRTLCWW
jgi:hypothetical protein